VRAPGKLALAATVLVAIHAAALGAGFLAPYRPTEQARALPYAPPTSLHVVDGSGRLHLRPFVYALVDDETMAGRYKEDRSQAFPIHFFVRGPDELGDGSGGWRLFGVEEPARVFLLGTDGFGRDQLSRLLHGARISLFAGLLATVLSLGVGWVLGTAAGFYGRWMDAILMRSADVFLALPWLYLLFAVRAVLPLHVSAAQAFLMLVLVIGLVDWARPARLVRGIVMSARERNYVRAARGFGASDLYLIRRHIAPQTLGVLFTQAALLVPQYILAEVTLSFLGLGVGEPMPSWGNMLAALQRYHVMSSYWWMWAPGLALVPVFLSYFALSEALHSRVGPASP
jgi:peptide/nickel transport system permease protein